MKNPFFLPKKNIVIFSRKNDLNLGDVIIGDCCKYALLKAQTPFRRANITIANFFEKDTDIIADLVRKNETIVFPGGGLNSQKFCNACETILSYCDASKKIYFNANGISKDLMSKTVKNRIIKIFSDDRVKQITTRGDYETALSLIDTPKEYPCKLILDPAIWAGETYDVKKKNSETIGIGVIRPEIFQENKSYIDTDAVLNLYAGIIKELEAKGYKWQLFCNGTMKDYKFAQKLLSHIGRAESKYLSKRPETAKKLVQQIATYKGIIATRFHANIIATSLEVPSIAIVWNRKMTGFSELIGCPDRYIYDAEILKNPAILVNKLEQAISEGYDSAKIENCKIATLETIKNILK